MLIPVGGMGIQTGIFGDGTTVGPGGIFAMTIGDGNAALRAIMGGKDWP
jgi:hypothetical protein